MLALEYSMPQTLPSDTVKSNSHYILGIDPGTGRTGWGVILHNERDDVISYIAHGCVVTTQEIPMNERLNLIHKTLQSIIDTHKPECMVVEQIFFGMNSRTAISVSQARGVVMLVSAQKQLPFYEYTGISVKHYLSGNGRAEKKDIQKIVRELLSMDNVSLAFSSKDKAFDDAADALAIAIHHAWKVSGKEGKKKVEDPLKVKLKVKKKSVKTKKKNK